jgi:hypothetical protein
VTRSPSRNGCVNATSIPDPRFEAAC